MFRTPFPPRIFCKLGHVTDFSLRRLRHSSTASSTCESRPIASSARCCRTGCGWSPSRRRTCTAPRSASTCGRARATSGPRRTACRTSSSTCCSAARRATRARSRSTCAIEELGGTLYAETGRDYSLYQIALAPAAACRAGWRSWATCSRRRRSATSTSSGRSSSRRSSRISTTAAATSTSTTSRASWPGTATRSGIPITGPLRNVRRFSIERRARALPALLRRRQHGAGRRRSAVAARPSGARPGRPSPACRAARAARPLAPRPAGPGPRFRAVHNESAQTQVHILFHALPETDPGYLALRALVRVLDDGMSTRLHYQICDQKGLAYSVAGTLHSYHDAALLEIDAACAHAKLPALVGESAGAARPLSRGAGHRGRARQGQAALRRATSSRRTTISTACAAGSAAPSSTAGPTPQEKRARALARVRPEDIRAVARRVLRPERAVRDGGRHAQPRAVAQGREDRPRLRVRAGPARVRWRAG